MALFIRRRCIRITRAHARRKSRAVANFARIQLAVAALGRLGLLHARAHVDIACRGIAFELTTTIRLRIVFRALVIATKEQSAIARLAIVDLAIAAFLRHFLDACAIVDFALITSHFARFIQRRIPIDTTVDIMTEFIAIAFFGVLIDDAIATAHLRLAHRRIDDAVAQAFHILAMFEIAIKRAIGRTIAECPAIAFFFSRIDDAVAANRRCRALTRIDRLAIGTTHERARRPQTDDFFTRILRPRESIAIARLVNGYAINRRVYRTIAAIRFALRHVDLAIRRTYERPTLVNRRRIRITRLDVILKRRAIARFASIELAIATCHRR